MSAVRLMFYTVAGDFVREIPFERASLPDTVEAAAVFGYGLKSVGSFSIYEARGQPLKLYWSHSQARKVPTAEEIHTLCQKYA